MVTQNDVIAWIEKYDLAAKQEGWMMTNNSADCYCIARLDDPQAWIEDGWPLDFSGPRFDADEAAVAFCRSQDDEMHNLALAIHDARMRIHTSDVRIECTIVAGIPTRTTGNYEVYDGRNRVAAFALERDAERFAALLCGETARKQRRQVTVTVSGGVVQDVLTPAGVEVIVRDYDVDSCDPESLSTDSEGSRYYEAVYGRDRPANQGEPNAATSMIHHACTDGNCTATRLMTVTPDVHGLVVEVEGCERCVIVDVFADRVRAMIAEVGGDAIEATVQEL